MPTSITRHDQRAASFTHILPVAINIRTSYSSCPPNPDVVGAFCSPTAQVKRHEQVIVTTATNNKRSFNRARLSRTSRATGQRIESRIAPVQLTCVRIDLAELDATPKAAKRQPWLTAFV